MFMLFIVLFSVVTTFSNFQATFRLIAPKVFGIFTPNFTIKVRKILLNFWYQNHSGLEKFWGMMLWIMSGTFKLHNHRESHVKTICLIILQVCTWQQSWLLRNLVFRIFSLISHSIIFVQFLFGILLKFWSAIFDTL